MLEQLMGTIALSCWAASIQSKEKKSIMKLQVAANLFYAIQYYMLGAYSAASMNVVSTIRSIMFARNEINKKNNTKLSLFMFVIAIVILGILTCNKIISIIPIIIALAYTYATWQKNTKVLRITFLVAAIVWFFYNSIVGAYAPLVGNVIEIISGIVAISRFDINQKED